MVRNAWPSSPAVRSLRNARLSLNFAMFCSCSGQLATTPPKWLPMNASTVRLAVVPSERDRPSTAFAWPTSNWSPVLRRDVDSDVLGRAQPRGLRLDRRADVRPRGDMVAEQQAARVQHFFVGGECEHRFEQRFAVLHRDERRPELRCRTREHLQQCGDEVARQRLVAVELAPRLRRIALHPRHGIERDRLRAGPRTYGEERRPDAERLLSRAGSATRMRSSRPCAIANGFDVRVVLHGRRTGDLPEALRHRPRLHREHLVQVFGAWVAQRRHAVDRPVPVSAEPVDRLRAAPVRAANWPSG